MILLVLIAVITAIYYCIMIALFDSLKTANMSEQQAFTDYIAPASIILMVDDFILNSSLMILFIYKLRQVSLMNDNIDRTIIDVMTRHTLLFGSAVITNQLFFIGLIVTFITDTFLWYIYVLRGFENLANIIVLYLSLQVNNTLYLSICKSCHIKLRDCFTKSVMKRYGIQGEYHLFLDEKY